MLGSVERDLARRALDTARTRGATYADVRFVRRSVEDVLVKNGHLENVDRSDTYGFAVRTIADGAWGFAASPVLTAAEADRVAALAVEVARASALTKREDARLAPVKPVTATYTTPIEIDPWTMQFDERVRLLLDADAAMKQTQSGVVREPCS